ncbi:MAG: polyhydroxyalkanoic acid system family protein [Deltaproteobacteria bacterium]|nr:polyhydroxyalkanoic acid system family protein [Deltaproteobacteria bacterium]
MSEIKIERSHKLGSDEAKKRFAGIEAKLKERYGVALEWQGHNATVKGSGVTGDVKVTSDRIAVVLRLGFLVRPFAAKIREAIERQVDEKLV